MGLASGSLSDHVVPGSGTEAASLEAGAQHSRAVAAACHTATFSAARSTAGPSPAGVSRPVIRRSCERDQKSQSSSSVFSAVPMTYEEPEPEKKSWFSSEFGDSAERMAGFTLAVSDGNIAS